MLRQHASGVPEAWIKPPISVWDGRCDDISTSAVVGRRTPRSVVAVNHLGEPATPIREIIALLGTPASYRTNRPADIAAAPAPDVDAVRLPARSARIATVLFQVCTCDPCSRGMLVFCTNSTPATQDPMRDSAQRWSGEQGGALRGGT